MSKLFATYFRIIRWLVFLFSVLIIVFHFYFIGVGFYFAGDTISNFTPAYPGKIGDFLSVFLWSDASWPPGMTFILHTLRILPLSIIGQHQVYVILASFLSVCITYLIARRITDIKIWYTAIIALSLFTGVQAFLFTTALSEPLLIFAWLSAIVCLERFMSTQKERFLLLYIPLGSFVPISRYLGIWVLLGLNVSLLFYVLITWRDKKYSPALAITSVILTFVPIFIYFIRNYLLTANFTGGIASLIDQNFRRFDYALMSFLPNFISDSILLVIVGVILGEQFRWNKVLKYLLFLLSLSIGFYYLGYAFTLTRFRATEIFYSRYISVAYPALMLLAICIGSFIGDKAIKFSKLFLAGLIFLTFIFGSQLALSIKKHTQEINSPQSLIGGLEYSVDIRKLCLRDTSQKYIFLQDSSLNWIGQGLGFYCQPISIIPFNANTFELSKGVYLFTPYKLNTLNLELKTVYKGDKEVRVYRARDKTILNIKDELQRQIPLDWFNGAKFGSSSNLEKEENIAQKAKEWVLYKSEYLGFSTQIPDTWQIYSVPRMKAVFFSSDIYKGGENKYEFYSISTQKVRLEDKTLEELYFPRDQFGEDGSRLFQREKKGDYLILRTEFLNTQDNIYTVFITKDGKNFIRFSLVPFSKGNQSKAQKRIVEDLNRIVEETKIF